MRMSQRTFQVRRSAGHGRLSELCVLGRARLAGWALDEFAGAGG